MLELIGTVEFDFYGNILKNNPNIENAENLIESVLNILRNVEGIQKSVNAGKMIKLRIRNDFEHYEIAVGSNSVIRLNKYKADD